MVLVCREWAVCTESILSTRSNEEACGFQHTDNGITEWNFLGLLIPNKHVRAHPYHRVYLSLQCRLIHIDDNMNIPARVRHTHGGFQ